MVSISAAREVGRGVPPPAEMEEMAFLCTFCTILQSTGCDVERLNIDVGAKIRGGRLSPLAAPSL